MPGPRVWKLPDTRTSRGAVSAEAKLAREEWTALNLRRSFGVGMTRGACAAAAAAAVAPLGFCCGETGSAPMRRIASSDRKSKAAGGGGGARTGDT